MKRERELEERVRELEEKVERMNRVIECMCRDIRKIDDYTDVLEERIDNPFFRRRTTWQM